MVPATASSLLETLPPRPPTPPRGADKGDARPSILSRIFSMDFGSSTPQNQSPESSAEPASRISERSQKKVEWSAWTEYKDPPRPLDTSFTPTHQDLRPLPPSGERKPTKSILKPYNGVIPVKRSTGNDKLAAPHTYANFALMLESIVRQLAGEDRSSRIDAYVTLAGVLKASDTIPDTKALKEKMSLLAQFMQRDMSAKTTAGTPDTAIVNHALVLLNIFVWKQPIAETMSVDFCVYVVDHSISAFEDNSVSKEVVRQLLYTMGTQNFSIKVMNTDRVGRLIQSLVKIEDHVKGRSIISLRLAIYRKLLKQAKMSMISNLGWIETLFTDMCSSLKDIQSLAVAFGFEASLELGTDSKVSRAVTELFNMQSGTSTYAQYYVRKLSTMIRTKDSCASVPQIWSIVVLFLRYRQHQLEHWVFIKPWIQVLQECFNKGDHPVKAQANIAWNRFVFALRLDENTTISMVRLLEQGLSGQLKRKLVGKHAKETRRILVGGISNLLYYALRPSAPTVQLDMYWDEYVEPLIGQTLVLRVQDPEMVQADLVQACAMMGAFFDIIPKPWRENRANEDRILDAGELPGLDPKWIRKNAHRVFLVLGPLIEKCFWDLTMEESPISSVWKKFVASVVLAGMKEVKVSNDTMTSVAYIFNLLFKIWQEGPKRTPAAKGDADSFEANFSFLINTTIGGLGVLPFTEKLLSIGPQETFAIVATPSHHPQKVRGEVKSPLHHLFGLLAQPPAGLRCDDGYSKMIAAVLRPFFESRTSQRSRIDLLRDLSQLVPPRSPDSKASCLVWQALATCGSRTLDRNDEANSSGSSSHDQPLGVEYRNVLRFLELGVTLSPEGPLKEWEALFVSIAAQITRESGDSGRAISLIEPLARTLSTKPIAVDKRPSLAYCPIVVSSATHPTEKQALEAARRRLWGISSTNPKNLSFDPFSHLYIYVSQCLTDSYTALDGDQASESVGLLTAVTDLIRRCPTLHMTNLLSNSQDGIGIWIKDDDLKFRGRSSSKVAASVATLWESVCVEIRRIQLADSDLLKLLEPLLCSGLESKHQSTVNDAITMWNSSFGCQSHLNYPPRVTESLLRLRSFADLQLPGLPEDVHDEPMSDAPIFLDAQEDSLPYIPPDFDTSGFSEIKAKSPILGPSLPSHRSYPHEATVEAAEQLSRHRSYQGTPERAARKTVKKELTPKLRHDDSQIQFATIESSPLDAAAIDSQLLTDRQREVKERQAETAAMFPDLRSSPMPMARSAVTKLPTIVSDSPRPEASVNEEPATPIIAGTDKVSFEDYVISSPTPRRGQVNFAIDSDAIDPPSSPPELPVHEKIKVPKLSFTPSQIEEDHMEDNLWDVTSFSSTNLLEREQTSTDLGPSAQIDPTFMDFPVQLMSFDDSMETSKFPPLSVIEPPGTPVVTRNTLSPGQSVFLDALSSPSQPSDEVFVDARSSPHRPKITVQVLANTEDQEVILSESSQNFQSTSQEPEQNVLNVTEDTREQVSTSSPESYIDEDSMLRLITKFDVDQQPQDDMDGALEVEPTKDITQAPKLDVHRSIESFDEVDDEESNLLDCITVELKGVSASQLRQEFDRRPAPPPFVKPTRTSPYNLTRNISSTIPETPLKVQLQTLAKSDSTRSESTGSRDNRRRSSVLEVSAPRSPKVRAVAGSRISSREPTDTPRKRTRGSAKVQELDDVEDTKRRKTEDGNVRSVPDSQEMRATRSPAPAKKTKGRPPKKRSISARSSPRAASPPPTSENATPPASVDLDAPMHDQKDILVGQDVTRSEFPTLFDRNCDPGPREGGQHVTEPENLNMERHGTLEAAATLSMPQPSSVLEARLPLLEAGEEDIARTAMEEETVMHAEGDVGDVKTKSDKTNEAIVISRFEDLLEAMKSVTFTREGARKMDNLYWDLRAELSAAEKRGREG